jgi:hypothetical protein
MSGDADHIVINTGAAHAGAVEGGNEANDVSDGTGVGTGVGISTVQIIFWSGVAFPVLPICLFCLACCLKRKGASAKATGVGVGVTPTPGKPPSDDGLGYNERGYGGGGINGSFGDGSTLMPRGGGL